ncbi:MAG TPA: acetyl-CoA carboxylase biotin carboxyl carrier protein [Salinibacter sp.]|nr:acetyl-CoA carboxylase biotin carboxyl carrier protein [Salinibacter sp.]
MKLSKIQELLRLVAESDVSEIEIEEDDFKLTIRQNSPQVFMQPAGSPAQSGYGPPPQWQQQGPPPASPQPHQAPQQPAQPQQPPSGQPQPSASGGAQSAAAGQAQGGAAQDGASSASAQEANENGAAGADTETAAEEYVVKAPIVGTFYEAPSPDSDPFVEVGDSVSEGDVLCIIEAMKLMNEIECETSGTIQEILVEDAEPVEFDQPLFVIDED